MKVIHWSPVKNKNAILEKGILIQDTWISASILTPFKNLNRWWLDFSLNEGEYLGFVFELNKSDFPLVHAHWCIDSYQEQNEDLEVVFERRHTLKDILDNNSHCVFQNNEQLKKNYKEAIVWRIGGAINEDNIYRSDDDKIKESGQKMIHNNKRKAFKDFFDNSDFMEFVFEDYQVLLFKDIAPARIEKVIKSNTNYKYHDLLDEIKASF